MKLSELYQLNFAYLESFTKRYVREFGSIFCDEGQPDYWEANHCHVDSPVSSLDVIDEVVQFYEERGLPPRFYLYSYLGEKV